MGTTAPAHLVKPPSGAKLNFAHPLSQGCVGAWLLNEGNGSTLQDAAGKNNGFLPSDTSLRPVWSSNTYGTCLEITGINQYAILGETYRLFDRGVNETFNNFSIVHCFRKTDAVLTHGWAFGVTGVESAIGYTFGAQIPNAGGDILWVCGGSDPEIHIQNANFGTFPAIGLDIWVFTNSFNRGLEIWKNGHVISYGLNKNPTIVAGANALALGDINANAGSGINAAELGQHNFLYAYDRALTPTEITQISTKPFDMFSKGVVPLIVLNEYGIYNEIPTGGVEVGGIGNLLTSDISIGGIETGGLSIVNSIPAPYTTEGGVEAGGSAIAGKDYYEIATGGIEAGGEAIEVNLTGVFGGAEVGGTAVVHFIDVIEEVLDGEGAIVGGSAVIHGSVFTPPIDSAGAELGGEAGVYEIISATGGAEVGGEIVIEAGITTATGTGGAVCGGSIQINWFITDYVLSFAALVGGRAINIRRGPINNIKVGYALGMSSDNYVKDDLAASLAPQEIFTPHILDTPLAEDDIRKEEQAKWCYIEDCKDNVLPRVVEKRQDPYMPPRIREDVVRERQIAQLTAL